MSPTTAYYVFGQLRRSEEVREEDHRDGEADTEFGGDMCTELGVSHVET